MANDPIFTAPWYPWYADDILLSERVELMSLAEEGAYRRALDRAWKKGSIPADPVQCARAIGKGCSKKIAAVVLKMFTPMPDDPTRVIQDRLEIVREEQRQKYLSAANRGSKGGRQKASSAKAQLQLGSSPALAEGKHSDTDIEEEIREEEKKEEMRKAASPPPKKGTRLPEPFYLTTEMREYARIKRPTIDVNEETEKFVNYWRAKTGRDATKLDWIATWQNWILNARTNGNGKSNYSKRTDADVIEQSADFYDNYPA